MNRLLTLIMVISLFSCNSSNRQKCLIPELLRNEIEQVVINNNINNDNFFKINDMLFDYEFKDSLATLRYCNCYSHNITNLFNSNEPEKRVIAYRLISSAQDSSFNDSLIKRIKSNENSLLKTWSSIALMTNRHSVASDELFKLFSSSPEGLPVHTLIKMYLKYDTVAVKKTCWKYIDSENRNEQVMSIQCLASFEQDKILQQRLIKFLDVWDTESQGWVISSMAMQKMGNLKPLLEKYVKIENLKSVIIRALEKSPTKMDNDFAKKLRETKN